MFSGKICDTLALLLCLKFALAIFFLFQCSWFFLPTGLMSFRTVLPVSVKHAIGILMGIIANH